MSEHLSIANLLSLLQFDPQDNALQLCREADSLRRRRRYTEAIELAERGVQMSRSSYVRLGVALLFLSSIRASAHRPNDGQLAIRDCERAIRALSIHPHNHAIALVLLGQIQLEIDEEANQADALASFDQARQALDELILTTREYHQQKYLQIYRNLQAALTTRIGQLSAALAAVEPIKVWPKEAVDQATPLPTLVEQATIPTRPGQATPIPIRLPIPTKLIWPTTEQASLEVVAVMSGVPLDSVEISQLSIEGHDYKINPIKPTPTGSQSLRLQHGQQYVTMQVDSKVDQRVLIRRQDRPDQKRQFIVVADLSRQQAWIDDAESTVPFKVIHIIGAERRWNLRDGSDPTPLPEDELRIIGVVEAILTLTEPTETMAAAA